ncbi:MAG: hypothetical protein ACRD6X_04550 [Pyrinomonadaceae bacterium]
MIRELVTKLSGVLERNKHSIRKRCDAPIRITFEPVRTTGNLHTTIEGLSISGEAADVSKSGISFIVPSIRVKEFYLVGQDRRLNLELDLPDGRVKMTVLGRRYIKIGQHLSDERFFVGAEIVDMKKESQQIYDEYLRFALKRAKTATPRFEMGID